MKLYSMNRELLLRRLLRVNIFLSPPVLKNNGEKEEIMKGRNRLAASWLAALFLIVGVATTAPSPALGSELIWVTQAGGTAYDQGLGIALDAAGNKLVTGYFTDTATFGAGEPNETVLTSAGYSDIFVAKFDPDGALLWVTQAGGTGYQDWGRRIAVDGAGNSLVTGRFSKTATFGAGESNETLLTADGGDDIFVAKYDPDGVLLWVTQAGSDYDVTSTEEGNDIALDAAGNSLVTGRCTGTAIFGAGEPNETVLTSCNSFIAKYDPDGALLWAKALSGSFGWGITLDAVGNILVTGVLNEGLFVKYDADGALLWATQVSGEVWGYSIAVDPAANITVTGSFRNTATFGAGELNETLLTADDFYSDLFVAKYDADGALLWVTQAGAEGANDGGFGAVDVAGNVLVAGLFGGTAIFGAGEPNETLLTAAGNGDIFVAKYDPDGALLWVTQAGSESEESEGASDIAVDAVGDCVITGRFYGAAIFGAGEPNETALTAIGGDDVNEDIFVAKYAGGGTIVPAADITVTDSVAPIDDLTVAFGDVTELTTADQTVTVTNDGSADLVLGNIAQANPLASPFSIQNDTCSTQTLTPAANCTLTVRFSPPSTGAFSNSFDIPSDDPDENPVTFNVSGTGIGIPVPDITVTDSVAPIDDLDIAFGDVTQASTLSKTVTITNDGNAGLTIGNIATLDILLAPFSILNDACSGATLAPATDCTMTIRFSPTSIGSFSDSFDIPSDDSDEASLTINLSGAGVPIPVSDIAVTDSVDPADDLKVSYGTVILGASSEEMVTITNEGSASLNIGQIAQINTLAAPFSILNDGCSLQTLAQDSSCSLTVKFEPQTAEAFSESFDIPSDDPDESSVVFNLSGIGEVQTFTGEGGGSGGLCSAGPFELLFGLFGLSFLFRNRSHLRVKGGGDK